MSAAAHARRVREEFIAQVERLAESGATMHVVARRVGLRPTSVAQRLRRYGRADLVASLPWEQGKGKTESPEFLRVMEDVAWEARDRWSHLLNLCEYDWPDDPDRLCDGFADGPEGLCAGHRAGEVVDPAPQVVSVPVSGHGLVPTLPTSEVARRVGVDPSTLFRWARNYGLGPTGVTPGVRPRRRYSHADVDRLMVMRRLRDGGVPAEEAAEVALYGPRRPRPQAPPEPTWSIHEAATKVGLRPVTLRRWARRYALGPRDRGAGCRGWQYTQAEVDRLARVVELRAAGMPTDEAARVARYGHAGRAPRARSQWPSAWNPARRS